MTFLAIEGISISYQKFNIMQGLFTAKWAANKVQNYMTSLGLGVRRSTVQLVRRHVLDMVKKEALVRKLAPTQRPTKGYLVEMDWERSYRYKVFGEWELLNEDTGEYTTKPWSIYSDFLPTNREVEQKLADQYLIGETDPEGLIQNIVVRQYLHKQGTGY